MEEPYAYELEKEEYPARNEAAMLARVKQVDRCNAINIDETGWCESLIFLVSG